MDMDEEMKAKIAATQKRNHELKAEKASLESLSLTDEVKRELSEKARKQVTEELTKEQKAAFLDAEVRRLRAESGLDKPTVGGVLDEIVEVTIDLPTLFTDPIQLNLPDGPKYNHGQTYRVPRHVANVLWDQMQRLRDHQLQVDGKSLTKERARNIKLSPNGAVVRGEAA